MNTIGDRLKAARGWRNLSQEKLAKAVGCTQGTISQLEKHLSDSTTFDDELAEALGVRREWLVYGRGSPHESETPPTALKVRESSPPYEASDYVFLNRISGASLSAGNGELLWDFEEIEHSHAFRRDWIQKRALNPDRCRLFSIRGDSMAHTINNDDLVVVNMAEREIVTGEVYAVVGEDGLRAKRIHRRAAAYWLTSDNPDKIRYPDEPFDGSNYAVIGRVVWRGGDL